VSQIEQRKKGRNM